jgi:FMN hydrolase / 5-amino-6-(5-phospho-D-ribitylamino)uracil phosphatase
LSAVTLDLWHTLFYLEPADEEVYLDRQVELARRILAESPQIPGAPDCTSEELGLAFEKVYAEAVAESGVGHSVSPVEQLKRAGRATGREPDTVRYLRELELLVRNAPFQRAPGAIETLQGLRKVGYRVGIVSNTVGEPGRFLRPALRSMGFDQYVESYVFSDEQPWAKPAPEIFYAALRELNARPAQAVHVGDGWADMEGARRARFRAAILFTGLQAYASRYAALFLPPGWQRPAADHEVARLEEILPLVRTLLPDPSG